MADRFPSLEEFGEDQIAPAADQTLGTTDAESDFLARERATLGQDAEQFADEEDLRKTSDLLGGDADVSGPEPQTDTATFETSFPVVDANTSVGPGGGVTGPDLPYRTAEHNIEESEPVRAWRERRDLALAERDRISSAKKEETVKAARQNLDDFYENYSQKTEKQLARTRQEASDFLSQREDTTAGGTSWERIAKLVDLSGKGATGGASGSSKQKFRDLLLDLRKDEKAPGVAGV